LCNKVPGINVLSNNTSLSNNTTKTNIPNSLQTTPQAAVATPVKGIMNPSPTDSSPDGPLLSRGAVYDKTKYESPTDRLERMKKKNGGKLVYVVVKNRISY
jgi:hypothetical protein